MYNFENLELYEVSRADYSSFLRTIKPECRYIKEDKLDRWHMVTKVMNKKTNDCFGSRISYIRKNEEEQGEPERYYIFTLPTEEEKIPPIPTLQITLETKEEVQEVLDKLRELKEKQSDEGNI